MKKTYKHDLVRLVDIMYTHTCVTVCIEGVAVSEREKERTKSRRKCSTNMGPL